MLCLNVNRIKKYKNAVTTIKPIIYNETSKKKNIPKIKINKKIWIVFYIIRLAVFCHIAILLHDFQYFLHAEAKLKLMAIKSYWKISDGFRTWAEKSTNWPSKDEKREVSCRTEQKWMKQTKRSGKNLHMQILAGP
jgi:hypothetical protein